MTRISGNQFEQPKVYAVKHKSDTERMASQSGGMFAVISDEILRCGGVVYGCVFDESYQAVHIRADTPEQRNRMRYSKYVQSSMGETFKNVLKDLEEGRTVLFSGTSCQVAGIRRYLEMFPDKAIGEFYTVDIVCHGVPSPRIWRDYLEWEKNKKKSQIADIVCRNKKDYGWKSHVVTISFRNGKKVSRRVFPKIFYSHVALRPSCYKCPYKDIHHSSDITIADYWGIDKALPGFKDEKGVSLALVNNDRGESLFIRCRDSMIFKATRMEDSMQKPLLGPFDPPANREQFWHDYEVLPFEKIAVKYGNYSILKDVNWKTRSFIKRKVLMRVLGKIFNKRQ